VEKEESSLKGRFYVSTQQVCDAVLKAENATKSQDGKKQNERARLTRTRLRVKRAMKKKVKKDLGARFVIVL
jgi:hypothetical protein